MLKVDNAYKDFVLCDIECVTDLCLIRNLGDFFIVSALYDFHIL